jgi:sporulation protein YlmC with PRC-barrel domain
MKNLAVLLALITMSVAAAVATAQPKGPIKPPTHDLGVVPQRLDDTRLLKQDFGPVLPASSFLSRQLVDRFHVAVGEITDLLVDLEQAECPLVVVSEIVRPLPPPPKPVRESSASRPAATRNPHKAASGKEGKDSAPRVMMVFPLAAVVLPSPGNAPLRLAGDRSDGAVINLDDPSEPLTRGWLVDQYEARTDRDAWKMAVHVPNQDSSTSEAPGHDSYRLARFTALRGAKIFDAEGQPVGKLGDLAVTIKQRRVPYAAVESEGAPGRMVAIPLAACVVTENQPWRIEAPSDLIDKSPSINATKWPTRFGEGWIEALNRRDGGKPRDGVEHRDASPPGGPLE